MRQVMQAHFHTCYITMGKSCEIHTFLMKIEATDKKTKRPERPKYSSAAPGLKSGASSKTEPQAA